MASQWRIGSRWSSVPAQASRNYQKIQDFWEGLCEARYLVNWKGNCRMLRMKKEKEGSGIRCFHVFPILPIPSHSFHVFPLSHPEAAESIMTCCSNPVVESGGASWIRCSLSRCNSAKVVIICYLFHRFLIWNFEFAFGTHLKFLIQGMATGMPGETRRSRDWDAYQIPLSSAWTRRYVHGIKRDRKHTKTSHWMDVGWRAPSNPSSFTLSTTSHAGGTSGVVCRQFLATMESDGNPEKAQQRRAEDASDLSVLFFFGLYMFVICLYFRTVMAAMARFEIIFYWTCWLCMDFHDFRPIMTQKGSTYIRYLQIFAVFASWLQNTAVCDSKVDPGRCNIWCSRSMP